jgi:hypothetical protein
LASRPRGERLARVCSGHLPAAAGRAWACTDKEQGQWLRERVGQGRAGPARRGVGTWDELAGALGLTEQGGHGGARSRGRGRAAALGKGSGDGQAGAALQGSSAARRASWPRCG